MCFLRAVSDVSIFINIIHLLDKHNNIPQNVGYIQTDELCLFGWYWVEIIKKSKGCMKLIHEERDVVWSSGCQGEYIQGNVECLKITPNIDELRMKPITAEWAVH